MTVNAKQKDLDFWVQIKPVWGRLLTGTILVILAIVVITCNERAAIETTKSLSSVYQNLRVVSDIYTIDPNNEGALVYLYGQLHVEEPLTEPDYGISVPAVSLKRRVQMFQWIEQEDLARDDLDKNVFPDEKYTYQTDWRDKLINSTNFHLQTGHQNPEAFPLKSKLYVSEVVRIGEYVFSLEIKQKFTEYLLITSDERPESRDIKLHAGLYYHSTDVWNPLVGDIRVQFSFAGMSGDLVSIIARQDGNMLGKEGRILITKGKVLPDAMIKDEHSRDVWSVRFYRSLGWIFLYIAAPFFTILLRFLSSRHRGIFNFLILDGILSPNIAFASILFTIIIAHIWYLYDPSIGLCIILAFLLPWLMFAIYKKCQFCVQKNRQSEK